MAGPEARVDDLAVFLEGSQRFRQALGRGDADVAGVGPGLLAGGEDAGADVARRVAGAQQLLAGQLPHADGQIVAEMLDQLAADRVVLHESGVIFDDAQGLASSIEVGVQNSSGGVEHGSQLMVRNSSLRRARSTSARSNRAGSSVMAAAAEMATPSRSAVSISPLLSINPDRKPAIMASPQPTVLWTASAGSEVCACRTLPSAKQYAPVVPR